MFTLRTMGGIAILMAGGSWLWLTPTFATRGLDTSRVLWTITMVVSLVTIIVRLRCRTSPQVDVRARRHRPLEPSKGCH